MAATSPQSSWTLDQVRDTPATLLEPAAPRAIDPIERFYRAPVARLLARALVRTPISSDSINFLQPFLAAVAGYALTFADARHLALGVLLFEARALLCSTAEALARAQKKASPDRGAVWISMLFLVIGVVWHFRLHPPAGAWGDYLKVNGLLVLALGLVNGWLVRSASRRLATAPAPASLP